jgi:uncharacterized protein YigE (DUF2233 family)
MRDTYGAAKLNERKALLSRILVENSLKLVLSVFIFLIAAVSVRAEPARCQSVTYGHSGYTVCEVDLRLQSVTLF